jgi:hypothetical protein
MKNIFITILTIKKRGDKINPLGKFLNLNSKRGDFMKKQWSKNYPGFAKAIKDRGLKISHVAQSAGLTYRQLYGRLTNEIDFELPIMRKYSKVFGESMDVLFNDKNF